MKETINKKSVERVNENQESILDKKVNLSPRDYHQVVKQDENIKRGHFTGPFHGYFQKQ